MTGMLKSCRSCGDTNLSSVLSLGKMPLANSLLTLEQLNDKEDAYPLALVFCNACTLVQITESVSPEKLFSEYLYLSSFSDSFLRHAKELALKMMDLKQMDKNSLVLEVASNDGYLLQYYQNAEIPVLGIEPAANVGRIARETRGIPTITDFFSRELAEKLASEGLSADVIHAHNVLAHVPDVNGFVQGVRLLLKKGGVAVFEVPYVKDMIDSSEFDTIYHEHLFYFSVTSLMHLFVRNGLIVKDVERSPIHGGSLRVFVEHGDEGAPESVQNTDLLMIEARSGMLTPNYYEGFGSRVENIRIRLLDLLKNLKADGHRIAAYGAAAKGSTLLNYIGIGDDTVDYVVDRSTIKQGKYMPGVHFPIYDPGRLLEDMPDYVLVLAWNFAQEIIEQQSEYRRRGGRFIIPIPEVKIV